VTEIAARYVRVLPLVVGVCGVLLLAQALHNVFGLGGSGADNFFEDGLHNFLVGASAVACLARAVVAKRGRLTWTMFGLSLVAFVVGDVTWTLLDEGSTNRIEATVSDIFWLSYYPFAIAGLVFLIRDGIEGFDLHRWIDGLAAALIATMLGFIFFVDPVMDDYEGGSTLSRAVEFAYPVCDVLLLGAVAGTFAVKAWRPGRTWLLLGLGLLAFTVADSIAAVQTVRGTYEAGRYDFLWTGGALVIALAAWLPYPARQPAVVLAGWKAVALPIACQVTAAGIQLLALFRHLPESERVLTVLVLAIATLQLWITRPRKPG
jgi:hypothetical protein